MIITAALYVLIIIQAVNYADSFALIFLTALVKQPTK